MFLSLGLLVNPKELFHISWIGLLIGFFMILIARPVSVLICLAPFRKMTFKSRLYVCWIGLRGAVPIIFATYPLIAGIQGAYQIFKHRIFHYIAFRWVFQGATVSFVARKLKLSFKTRKTCPGI